MRSPCCDFWIMLDSAIMVWGFTDHIWSPTQWLAGKAPDVFDGDYHVKPAYFALQRVLNESLAKANAKANAAL